MVRFAALTLLGLLSTTQGVRIHLGDEPLAVPAVQAEAVNATEVATDATQDGTATDVDTGVNATTTDDATNDTQTEEPMVQAADPATEETSASFGKEVDTPAENPLAKMAAEEPTKVQSTTVSDTVSFGHQTTEPMPQKEEEPKEPVAKVEEQKVEEPVPVTAAPAEKPQETAVAAPEKTEEKIAAKPAEVAAEVKPVTEAPSKEEKPAAPAKPQIEVVPGNFALEAARMQAPLDTDSDMKKFPTEWMAPSNVMRYNVDSMPRAKDEEKTEGEVDAERHVHVQ